MEQKLFGTDGIRGVANEFPMTIELAMRLAMVLSTLICTGSRRVTIAKDTRLSGYMLEAALTAGFTSMGVTVIKMGVVPTPLITSQIHELNVDMGVMITASHNPAQDNGIKLIDSYGQKFSDEWTAQVEDMLKSDTKFSPSSYKIGRVFTDEKSIPAYMENVLKIAPNFKALQNLRLVIDCANGAFSKIMPQIFKDLGAGVITLSNIPNGENINADCGSQHTENLQKTVMEAHAHLGLAVDGDGDRLVVCDDKGQKIDGDQIIAFLAAYLQKIGRLRNNAVVTTVWSNTGLEKYLHRQGIYYYKTPVGERYVAEQMRKSGAALGGEDSGHIVLADYANTGDGLIAGLMCCLALKDDGRPASQIFPIFRKYPAQTANIQFKSSEEALRVLNEEKVQTLLLQAKESLSDKGNIILRASGTEPVLKLKVEAEDELTARQVTERMVKELGQYQ